MLDELKELGVNVDEGLEHLMGDSALYDAMLWMFINSVQDAAISPEDFDAVLATNLRGAFLCMKQAGKLMMKQRFGRIINISSVVALRGNAGQVNYAASKAGIIGMTKSLARELASRNVTVNALAPGFIETAMTAALPEAVRSKMLEGIPAGRMGQPEDVAAAALFLASPQAAYITGQVLSVDGGMAM